MSAAGLDAESIRFIFFRAAAAVEGNMRRTSATAAVAEKERPRADEALQRRAPEETAAFDDLHR